MRVVLATNNSGKIRELQALLAPLQMQVLPKSQFTGEEVAETGDTFIENALIKARHASRVSGLPAIADDSGIEVDALGGAPGIYSARYAGEKATDTDNLNKLLDVMQSVPDHLRTARYRCALVYVRSADDARPLCCEATWEGRITRSPMGAGGFGYDPIFWLPDYQQTSAQISAELKNQLSHRAKALQQLVSLLRASNHSLVV
ncbi:MAG: RdgB/HAM1 family non-canonical purine NTP pyrophosphatase [Steroidobacter sp.]